MTLLLEIEYLSGVSFAAIGPDSGDPDWPPQPDRVFSALVATWAAGGERAQEAEALEWLEQLPPPRLIASQANVRSAPQVFVPPNDPRSDKQKNARGVLPVWRSRQARRFPAARLDDPVVRLLWPEAEPSDSTRAALTRLASDTAYVGHSTSLTRCRFLFGAPWPVADTTPAHRNVYPGRFAELRHAFAVGRRPLPGIEITAPPEAPRRPARAFGDRWLLLEHVSGDIPDLRACAVVARTIRDALLSGYRQVGLGGKVPEVISGHRSDGGPLRGSHLAIVALPFIGFPYADGHIMGFALIPPEGSAILDDEDFRKAFRRLAPIDTSSGRRVLTINMRARRPLERTSSIALAPTFEPSGRSLEAELYSRPSATFATVTPIALDRHLKTRGDERHGEIAAQIATACLNVGLPAPEQIVADKHSAFEGTSPAYPSGRSLEWLQWRVPSSLVGRQLTHAVFRFPAPIDGPVLLGAGRYVGLGLCRPLP
jgi:CRISPR-associated protein Csb2